MFEKVKKSYLKKNEDESNLNEEIFKLSEKLDKLSKENKKLNKKVSKLNSNNKKILNSYHDLFNVIFIDYELKPKGILKYFQELALELLQFYDCICKKHGLDYWLDFGTLLGASRHGGFIPWDDDLDVAMMRNDYIRFQEIINMEIENANMERNIHFEAYPETKKDFFLPFYKLNYTDDDGTILCYIDIFPYDYADSKDMDTDEFIKEKTDFYIFLSTHGDISDYISKYHERYGLTPDDGTYIIPGLGSPRTVWDYENKLYYWQKEKMLPTGKISFGGKMFSCPQDVDYYLSTTYREYTKIPKVIKDHEILKDLRSQKKTEEIFEANIEKMRRVNDKMQKSC